jgi:hypothetical protein
VCVCAFSLRRESPDMILGDKPLIFEVVLSQREKHGGMEGHVKESKARERGCLEHVKSVINACFAPLG